ncbi:hypothetical protein WG66_002444 [Moniliophthora roreri]|nr:hypothetical protein WG66_002444 [Moniliophthora roreri]
MIPNDKAVMTNQGRLGDPFRPLGMTGFHSLLRQAFRTSSASTLLRRLTREFCQRICCRKAVGSHPRA